MCDHSKAVVPDIEMPSQGPTSLFVFLTHKVFFLLQAIIFVSGALLSDNSNLEELTFIVHSAV